MLALSQSVHGHLLLGEGEYSANHFRREVPPETMPKIGEVVARYYPAFKDARAWLRKNAPLLHPQMLTEF